MYTSTVGAHVTSCLTVLFVECARGFVPSDTINLYGPSSWNTELPATNSSTLYVFPSMNFSCDGTITDIRMRIDFVEGLQSGVQSQVVAVYFLLFHDKFNSPTRRVTHILLNSANTEIYYDRFARTYTEIWHAHSLSLSVREGTFIGFAVPENDTRIFSRNINLSPTSERVEAYLYQLAVPFSEFEERVLEAARTADSSQFTTAMIPLPLIDVSVGKFTHMTQTALLCLYHLNSSSPLLCFFARSQQTNTLSLIHTHFKWYSFPSFN